MEEIIGKVEGYRARASFLLENGQTLFKRGEFEKAGEFFWGAVGAYINALGLLHTGKAHQGHAETVKDAKRIATEIGDSVLDDAIKFAEKLHANYYMASYPRMSFLNTLRRRNMLTRDSERFLMPNCQD